MPLIVNGTGAKEDGVYLWSVTGVFRTDQSPPCTPGSSCVRPLSLLRPWPDRVSLRGAEHALGKLLPLLRLLCLWRSHDQGAAKRDVISDIGYCFIKVLMWVEPHFSHFSTRIKDAGVAIRHSRGYITDKPSRSWIGDWWEWWGSTHINTLMKQ